MLPGVTISRYQGPPIPSIYSLVQNVLVLECCLNLTEKDRTTSPRTCAVTVKPSGISTIQQRSSSWWIRLWGIILQACLTFLDYVIVVFRTFSEHLDNFHKVFQTVRWSQSSITVRNCSSFRRKCRDYNMSYRWKWWQWTQRSWRHWDTAERQTVLDKLLCSVYLILEVHSWYSPISGSHLPSWRSVFPVVSRRWGWLPALDEVVV
jgi:hypothetical protein